MNTSYKRIPYLPKRGIENYEYCLEDLELAIDKEQLEKMTVMWNEGSSIKHLSKQFKKKPDEVILMLFHQARKGKIKRPFAYRE